MDLRDPKKIVSSKDDHVLIEFATTLHKINHLTKKGIEVNQKSFVLESSLDPSIGGGIIFRTVRDLES